MFFGSGIMPAKAFPESIRRNKSVLASGQDLSIYFPRSSPPTKSIGSSFDPLKQTPDSLLPPILYYKHAVPQ